MDALFSGASTVGRQARSGVGTARPLFFFAFGLVPAAMAGRQGGVEKLGKKRPPAVPVALTYCRRRSQT